MLHWWEQNKSWHISGKCRKLRCILYHTRRVASEQQRISLLSLKKGQEYTVLGQTLPPSQGDKHRDLDDSPGWTNSAIWKLSDSSDWKVRGHHWRAQEVINSTRMCIWWRCPMWADTNQLLHKVNGNHRELTEIIRKKSWKLLSFDPHFFFFVLWIKLWESFQKIKWKMQMLVVCPITETVVI